MKSQGLCHGWSYRVFVAPALQLKLEVKSKYRNTKTHWSRFKRTCLLPYGLKFLIDQSFNRQIEQQSR